MSARLKSLKGISAESFIDHDWKLATLASLIISQLSDLDEEISRDEERRHSAIVSLGLTQVRVKDANHGSDYTYLVQ